MDIKELNSFKVSDAITFHDTLNPRLFHGNRLQPAVEKQLKIIAQDFLEELGVYDINVKDITISGSNAAYSYTKHSDLDLHILVDLSEQPNDEVYKELFNAKKTLYNDSHDIKVNGIPIELYVQDVAFPVISLGEYSVLNNKWIKIPNKRRSNFDHTDAKSKYEKLAKLIEYALHANDLKQVKNVLETIKRYRQTGLEKGGEFGPENIVFKALRSQGLITKLYNLRDKLHSKKLSLSGMYQEIDENLDLTSLNRDVEKIKQSDSPIITPLQEINGYFYSAYMKIHKQSESIQWIIIECKTKSGKQVGLAEFVPRFSTKIIIADKVVVHKKYQNQGIAGTMYAYAKMLGFDVVRSDEQTTAGKKMWKAFDKSGAAKQLYHNSNGPITRKNDEFYQIPEGIVDEGFDQPYPITWEKGMHGDVDAFARLPDGTSLSIMFNKQDNVKPDDKTWMVEFYRNNSQEVTGEGDAQKVFATVLSAIQQFITKYKPLKIYFSASKLLDPSINYGPDDVVPNPESRAKLYDRLVQRYAKAWGYRAFRGDTHASVMYELSRIPKQKPVGEDYTGQFAAEKTPVISPYAGIKDNQYRGSMSEAPVIGNYADLYHTTWTDTGMLDTILQSGKLIPGRNKWLSLTRDSRLDYAKMMGQFAEFVIDQNKLRQRVKLDQYDDFKGRGDDEAEERVNVPIPLKGYVKSIHLPASWKHDEKAMQYYEPKLKQYGIPFYYDTMGSPEDRNADVPRLEEASGYIPSEKQKNDPRFKTALTVDVRPDAIKKNAKAFYWNTSRAGIPPTAKANGKI